MSISEYLIGQVRPLRELGLTGGLREGPLVRAFRESPGRGLARLAIGGRVQPFDEEARQGFLAREMDEREVNIRKAYRLAQRSGDDKAMQESSARLIMLYREFLNSGGDPAEVPKWARELMASMEEQAVSAM